MNGVIRTVGANGVIVETWSPLEAMKGSVPCSLFRDSLEELRTELDKKVCGPYELERARDWNYLSRCVVGCE